MPNARCARIPATALPIPRIARVHMIAGKTRGSESRPLKLASYAQSQLLSSLYFGYGSRAPVWAGNAEQALEKLQTAQRLSPKDPLMRFNLFVQATWRSTCIRATIRRGGAPRRDKVRVGAARGRPVRTLHPCPGPYRPEIASKRRARPSRMACASGPAFSDHQGQSSSPLAFGAQTIGRKRVIECIPRSPACPRRRLKIPWPSRAPTTRGGTQTEAHDEPLRTSDPARSLDRGAALRQYFGRSRG